MQKIKERKSKISKEDKELNARKLELEEELEDYFANEGCDSISYKGIGKAKISYSDFPNAKNKELFFKYLKETGQAEMIKTSVNAQTLRGWWNRMDEDEKPDPQEIGLEIFSKPSISITKG